MFPKLKGRIVEKFNTQADFAKTLGVSENWVSTKMNGKSDFTKADMLKWGDTLEIPKEQYIDYFF